MAVSRARNRCTAAAQIAAPSRKRVRVPEVLEEPDELLCDENIADLDRKCCSTDSTHDTTVSADDFVAPEALAQYQVTGYGGSDLSPALLHLAEDPQTRAVVAITDGDVALPAEAMPYSLLWLLPANGSPSLRPPYGRVLQMQRA